MHGAGSPNRGTKGGRPLKSGRYSKVKTEELREFIARHRRDPDPLNTFDEIATARALFEDWVNRYWETREALLRWHASFGKEETEPKPRQVLDLSDAIVHLDRITKMVERREKSDNRTAFSREEFSRVTFEMGRIMALYVTDEETLKKITDGWASIHVA